MVIKKVDKNTELMKSLLNYVENFSWAEVKEHTLQVIGNWEFEDWETPFAAMIDGHIVGIVTIMKSDYYPLPDIYPWISTLFVSEEYRGNRISEQLIGFANRYAKEIGFDKTYIPTEYIGLYEKYGYYYIKDIVNYGNGVDRLYAKDLG
ncbi:MAG: GNAT family N-acetyltransferase [Clostridia bacterium]|nr:GNAT family N-acetyltransferase [Clostridia bacterium]